MMEFWMFHERPPLVVFRILPDSPTTQPVESETNWTANNCSIIPDTLKSTFQVLPPFVVRRMVPRSPIAIAVLALSAQTPLRRFPCGSGLIHCHGDDWDEANREKKIAHESINKNRFI